MKNIFLILIRIYQISLSPLIGGYNCRFLPTCSNYSMDAIKKYGVLKGGVLSIRRILRCNPFIQSGVDEIE